MRCNLVEFRTKYNLTQNKVSELIGINRSTYISKYEHGGYLPDVCYFRLSQLYPDYLVLPNDFFYYTPIIIKANCAIYGYSQAELARRMGKSMCFISLTLNANQSLYDQKEIWDKIFPYIYMPYEVNGKIMYPLHTFQKKEEIPVYFQTNCLSQYKEKEKLTASIKLIDKYDPLTLRMNCSIYGYKQVEVAKMFQRSQNKIYNLLNDDKNIDNYKNKWDEIFPVFYQTYKKLDKNGND